MSEHRGKESAGGDRHGAGRQGYQGGKCQRRSQQDDRAAGPILPYRACLSSSGLLGSACKPAGSGTVAISIAKFRLQS